MGEEGADDVDVAALARQHERGDAFSVLRWTNGGGAGRATRSGVVVAPGGARRGWLAGDPGAGARGTRDGRGGRDGDAARGSRGRPTWNPGSAPSRSAASTASASPALAARSNRRELIAADGAAGRGAKCDASIRAPSIRVASTGTPASFGASRFRPGAFHRSSPRARLGRASFFESVVRPTSRRFLGPDTWAFLTRPSRVSPPRRSSAPRFRRLHPPAHTRARSARRAARRRRPGPERARAPSHTRSTRGAERGRSSPGDRAGAVESARATFPGRGLGLGRRRGGERADHRRVRRGARLEARYDGLRCVPAGLGVEVEVRVRVPRPGPRRRDVLPVRHLRACPSASLSPGPAPRRARDEDATEGEAI